MNIFPKLFSKLRFQKPTYLAACGHMTKLTGIVGTGEAARKRTLSLENGSPPYCFDCINKMPITHCALCGKTIHLGDKFRLREHGDFTLPPNSSTYQADNKSYVIVCSCRGSSGTFLMGEWIPPGKVRKIPTADEIVEKRLRKDRN